MKKQSSKPSPATLTRQYRERRSAVQRRLREFRSLPVSEYFYELAYCLLTPQSSAINSARAVESLRRQNFLDTDVDPVPLLHQRDYYVRFHFTKGKHLLALKNNFPEIMRQLSNGMSSGDAREWLVRNVKGIGYKEASHFLRNTGHRNLAILDRHILKNLVGYGVIRSIPKTLSRKRYLSIEKKFQSYAEDVGIPMDELDLLFWSMETGEILK